MVGAIPYHFFVYFRSKVFLTQFPEHTPLTIWLPRTAAVPTVKDNGVVRFRPAILRKHLHQCLLRLQHILLVNQSDPVADALHVRVHGDPLGAKRLCLDYIRCLAANTWQRHQFLPAPGHFPVELQHKFLLLQWQFPNM